MFKIEYEKFGRECKPEITQDIKDVGQILINIVNDERAENEAMQWCSTASWGESFINQKYRFKITCIYDEKHIKPPAKTQSQTQSMRNSEIIKAINEMIKHNKSGQITIYNDNCWYIDLERCPNGTLRFWVGYEDKRTGQCNGSLCSVRTYNNNIEYCADFKLKERVRDKIFSTYKELKKHNLKE